MSNCINHKNPDVVNMAQTAGLSPAVMASKIMLWQESNGLDNWPTINDLGLVGNIKPGVAELFGSNPELANAVYEALGFESNLPFVESQYTLDDNFIINDELIVTKELQDMRVNNWDGSINTELEKIRNEIRKLPVGSKFNVSKYTNPINTTLEEVISKINLSESNKLLLEKIRPLIKDTKIQYVDKFILKYAGAVYSDKYNTIRISKSEKNISLEEMIMHELLHAATFRKITYFETNSKGLSEKELKALNELEKIRVLLKEEGEKWFDKPRRARDLNVLGGYTTDSIHEIISYAFTNKAFRDAIAEIPYKGTKSILDKLVELIANIFGVKQDTVLNALLANAEVLLNNTQITPQQKQEAQQIYSQYLDSIGVTDIAYHHSETDISEFTSSSERYFQKELKKKNRYIPKLDDIVFLVKKPLTEEFMSKRKFIGSWGLKTPKTLQFNAGEKIGEGVHSGIAEGIFAGIEGNYDAIDFGRIRDNKTWSEVIAITNPKNAIKLGSKQDIENFANFVAYENSDFSKIGNINQFRDYIISKNFAAIEEFLVVNNKIDRKC